MDTLPKLTVPQKLTVPKAAAELGVTRGWINRLITQKRLPATLVEHPRGNYYEIDPADLDLIRGLKHTGRPAKTKIEEIKPATSDAG